MKSSDISSAQTPRPPSASTPRRDSFALTGPSAALDPRTNAVRSDLADIRLADRVFAPHYASPKPMVANRATPILAAPSADADVLSELAIGDVFDVLEIASTTSWGQRRRDKLVGYVATTALEAGDAELAA